MITIVEPKEHIVRLWGKQRIRDGDIYRMMRYVLRVDHDGVVLLHNVVTGQLVVLEQGEAEAVSRLPLRFEAVLDQLVAEHYLVPEEYDEHQQVVNLRSILRKLEGSHQKTDILHYVILTTTACNARCYYCYQQGTPIENMSEKTANQVVDYICQHCGERKQVAITWFGGEPTILSNRIDQICENLRMRGIRYRSMMISNGYLFDNELVNRAKTLWNLQQITITIDGTEQTYNQTKAYVNPCDSPYERVMSNIGMLLSNKIEVKIRMNYDVGNWSEYVELVEEVKERFPKNKRFLEVSAHRILGEYPSFDGQINHEDLEWYEEKKLELDAVTMNSGLLRRTSILPHMRYQACGAANGSVAVIMPNGDLVSCPDQIGANQIKGNIVDGITDFNLDAQWKQFVEYQKCADCCFMPYCVHMLYCNAKDNCASRKGFHVWAMDKIRQMYDTWLTTK